MFKEEIEKFRNPKFNLILIKCIQQILHESEYIIINTLNLYFLYGLTFLSYLTSRKCLIVLKYGFPNNPLPIHYNNITVLNIMK